MEFELETKSWHFWLANFGGRRIREWRNDNDLCSYIHAVAKGLFWFTLALSVCLMFVGLTLNMFYEVYAVFALNETFSAHAKAMIMFYLILLFLATAFGIIYLLCEKIAPAVHTAYCKIAHGRRMQEKPPSFIALTLRKFKEKTCFKIKFKYED